MKGGLEGGRRGGSIGGGRQTQREEGGRGTEMLSIFQAKLGFSSANSLCSQLVLFLFLQLRHMTKPFSEGCVLRTALQSAACETRGPY